MTEYPPVKAPTVDFESVLPTPPRQVQAAITAICGLVVVGLGFVALMVMFA